MDLAERAAFRVTRDGDTEISDDADDLLEAVESELRSRRFGAVVRLEVVELDLALDGRPAGRAARRQARRRLPDPRPARPRAMSGSSTTSTAPTSSTSRGSRTRSAGSRRPKDGDLFAEIGDARHRRRSTRTTRSRRASRRSSRAAANDPARGDAEDDRLPHEPRLGARAGPDRGGRERQAERLHRRAEGALRRAAEHRVGPLARAGGRPRRLRLPGSQDPRQDDARDPARGRRPPALRPHRHGQLPRDDGADLRGRRAVHRRPRHRRRHRRPLQLRHRLRPAAGASGRSSWRRSTLRKALVEQIRGGRRRGGGRRARADPDQGQQPRPTRRSSRSSTAPRRRAPRST